MKTNNNPLEKVIEKRVCEYAVKLGCYVAKFTSPNRRSVPDRLFITPTGKVFWIEFKRGGEKPTLAQAVEHEKLRRVNALVFVISDIGTGKQLILDILNGADNPRTVLGVPVQ
jgi:hypothetical protein